MESIPKSWLCVIGGVSIHLVLGTLYLWGNITTAVTSHLRLYDDTITYQKTLPAVFATALGIQGCTMLLGGLIERRIGARKTILLGGYILTLGTFLSSTAKSLAEISLYNGVMFGIGLGICYSAPITCACKWLPHRKGIVTGSIVAGFGLGAFVFGLISTRVLNPTHINIADTTGSERGYFDPDSVVPNRVPHMYIILGCCYFVLVSFAGWCVTEPTEAEQAEIQVSCTHQLLSLNDTNSKSSEVEAGIEMDVSGTSNPIISSSYQTQQADHSDKPADINTLSYDIGPRELLFHPLAWHLSTCLIMTTVGGMYLAGTYKTYGQNVFRSEAFLSTVGSISSLFNCTGRIFWGGLADHYGAIQTITFLSLFYSLIIMSYASSPLIGGEVGFALWTFMIFFFEGGNFALYPPICTQLFGLTNSGSNYGMIFSLYSVCVVLNITLLSSYSVGLEPASQAMGILTFGGFLNLLLLQRHMRNACKRSE